MAESGTVFTCDIDWAPEYAIERTLQFFDSLGFQPTYFATHDSPTLRAANVDLGIHPYLSRHVEADYEEQIRRLVELYPDAKGSRTHRNYFGYSTPAMLANCGLSYDASVVTWRHPCLVNRHFTGIHTLTYSWEDGLHFDYGLPLDPAALPRGETGTYVYNVHPIVIYLNSDSEERRKEATRGISDLTRAPRERLEGHVNTGRGICDVLREFVEGRETQPLSALIPQGGAS